LADSYEIGIRIQGLAAVSTFSFETPWGVEFKTYLTQKMLNKGFLASTIFYASIAHTSDIINSYFEELEKVFAKLADLSGPSDVRSLLEGPVSHAGFKRIN
jgi:hypothetical protein